MKLCVNLHHIDISTVLPYLIETVYLNLHLLEGLSRIEILIFEGINRMIVRRFSNAWDRFYISTTRWKVKILFMYEINIDWIVRWWTMAHLLNVMPIYLSFK